MAFIAVVVSVTSLLPVTNPEKRKNLKLKQTGLLRLIKRITNITRKYKSINLDDKEMQSIWMECETIV